MKLDGLTKAAVLLFVAVSLSVWADTTGSKTRNGGSGSSKSDKLERSEKAPTEKTVLTVYYFHGHVRCSNCINFEHFTDELLKRDFAKELASGRIVWKVVNVDLPENSHFVDEYKLYTKSLVLVPHSSGKSGEYKNLTKIWQFAGDKAKFQAYVREEILKLLGESK
ncbi:MAG: nitrophenyl compound nitroreductase subunit ArsF family protein [Candidatus Sumerlaeaceae bacterium]